MEQVFFRLHVRFATTATRFLIPQVRTGLEYLSFINALVLFGLLIWLHIGFVNPNPNTHCLAQYSKLYNLNLSDADVVKIHISSKWSAPSCDTCINEDNRSELPEPLQTLRSDLLSDIPSLFDTFTNAIGMHYDDSPRKKADVSKKSWVDVIRHAHIAQSSSVWAEYEASLFDLFLTDKVYLFSREKGFLMLRTEIREQRNIKQMSVTIPRDSACFGNSFMRNVLDHMIGHDTVVMNWIIASWGGRGYLYNVYSKELFNLNYAAEFEASTEHLERFVVFKIGVLFTTLFLFFTTTTLVSFTLRETQERMLKFTFLLQYHVRHRLPYAPLIFTHVVESLVFVPIMVGILFFLFEFFSDQLLAFMVLSVVWLCEVYSVVAVRTRISISFFPRIFFLYFTLFHVYFFSFPFGFSYVALIATGMLLQHAMLYFWNRCEIPALQQGLITATQPRLMTMAMQPAQDTASDSSVLSPVSDVASPRIGSTPPVAPTVLPPPAQRPVANAVMASRLNPPNPPNPLSPLSARSTQSANPPSLQPQPTVQRPQALVPPGLARHSSDSTLVDYAHEHVEMSRRIQRAQMQQLMSAQYGVQLSYSQDEQPDTPQTPIPPPESPATASPRAASQARPPLLGSFLWNLVRFGDSSTSDRVSPPDAPPAGLVASASTPALSVLDRETPNDRPFRGGSRLRRNRRPFTDDSDASLNPPRRTQLQLPELPPEDQAGRISTSSTESASRLRAVSYSQEQPQPNPGPDLSRRNTLGDISRNPSYNDLGFSVFGNASYLDDEDDGYVDESSPRAHPRGVSDHNKNRASDSDPLKYLWGKRR